MTVHCFLHSFAHWIWRWFELIFVWFPCMKWNEMIDRYAPRNQMLFAVDCALCIDTSILHQIRETLCTQCWAHCSSQQLKLQIHTHPLLTFWLLIAEWMHYLTLGCCAQNGAACHECVCCRFWVFGNSNHFCWLVQWPTCLLRSVIVCFLNDPYGINSIHWSQSVKRCSRQYRTKGNFRAQIKYTKITYTKISADIFWKVQLPVEEKDLLFLRMFILANHSTEQRTF